MKNTNDFSKCKVGDKLYFILSDEFETIYYKDEKNIALSIDNNSYKYNLNGCNIYGVQLLFWSKPEIIAPEKTKEKIPFDLEKALSGEYDLVTRDGREVQEWKWFEKATWDYECICAVINNELYTYHKTGFIYTGIGEEHELDLFLIEK